jgi:hypothetical protein
MNDGTMKMKRKGITLDVNNRGKITYDRFKDLVLNWDKLIEEEVITKTGVKKQIQKDFFFFRLPNRGKAVMLMTLRKGHPLRRKGHG